MTATFILNRIEEHILDEDAETKSLKSIVDMLYPDGINCRKCEQVRPHAKLTNRKAYSCAYCGTHVYPLAGTIFEKSRTSLTTWFYAILLLNDSHGRMSAHQLGLEVGVTYKTAWRMRRLIRPLLGEANPTTATP